MKSARRRRTTLALTVLLLTAAVGCQEGKLNPEPPARTGDPAPQGRDARFTLVASGDVLPHSSVIRQANADAGGSGYDFRPMLAGVQPVVARADLAICHMETVYGADGDYSGYPLFRSPPEVAAGLAATGYDACSTASNHTLDDGAAGIHRTLDALDRAGVRHAGSARTAEEARTPTLLRAGPAKVAHLAYTYGTNGIPLPEGRPWSVNLIDRDRILADARAARKAGADVVVLSLHWGSEWQDAPDAQQLRLSHELTEARTDGRPAIDLILGTHAHVPQAYEKVNGTWVVYGMGDQIAGAMVNHSGAHDPRGNESTIGRFTFAPPAEPGGRWKVEKAEFVPQWFDTGTHRVVNLNERQDQSAVRDRIRQVVLSRGAAEDGLVMGK
ncbi:CapA family protein [Streptomyces sp. NBC_00286]|uniref:CapA family protein n=1 Tax=Streptomyces sp. NBC_00286 TaxID=2975701 RepID=UPI002E2AB294|nr:CapA family protein [Streptomyces sp. NBC_00286]